MAWQIRVKSISTTAQATDEAGNPITLDLSKQGRFVVEVEYLDDGGKVAHTQRFEFPSDIPRDQALALIRAEGKRVRDVAVRVAELQQFVGKTIPLDSV